MVERDVASVDWSLTGAILNQPIDVSFQSIIKLNLLSGRIIEHRYSIWISAVISFTWRVSVSDSWDLGRCSPLAGVAFTISRTLWSLQQLQQGE